MKPLFQISIANKQFRLLTIITVFVFVIAAITLAWFAVHEPKDFRMYALFAIVTLTLLSAYLTWKSLSNKARDVSFITYIILSSAILQFQIWWLIILLLILAFASLVIKKQINFQFFNEHIVVDSFPKKEITWNQLQNVVLKDGLLTLDFKNNKILQAEILTETSNVSTEQDFNDFCKNKLSASSPV